MTTRDPYDQLRDQLTAAIEMAEDDMGSMAIILALEKALLAASLRHLCAGNYTREAIYWAAFDALMTMRVGHEHDVAQLKEARG